MTLTPLLESGTDLAEVAAWASDPATLRTMLDASENHIELLQESVADLEHAAEDRGWRSMSQALEQEFTRQGLTDIVRNCRVMAIASPLIKRGVMLRIGYVWGQGISVQARAGEDAAQDVNQVVQDFWDDESNQASFTSSQAQEDNERTVATDGQVFLALFTDPLTGRVQVRVTPFEEVVDVIRNPEDRAEPWFYLREYDATVVREFQPVNGPRTTRTRKQRVKVLHPALGFRPAQRPKVIDGVEIMWDAPILHVAVNRPTGWKWGVPDVYASLPWARAYDGFLTDWARLVRALSKFAWKLSGDRSSKVQRAAGAIRQSAQGRSDLPLPNGGGPVGAVAAMGPGQNLEAIPKTGATIDSDSGRPLAAMVAAGIGVSVVDLLADPGTTGARAVAETLDKPVTLEMGMRRQLWRSVIQTITSYVVDQAVKAPRGPLSGTVTRDAAGRERVVLAGDVERTVTVDFPDIDDLDPVQLVTAIAAAAEYLPPLERLRLFLQALRVKDVDEVIATVTDPVTGEYIDPLASAGDVAVQQFRQGNDPGAVA